MRLRVPVGKTVRFWWVSELSNVSDTLAFWKFEILCCVFLDSVVPSISRHWTSAKGRLRRNSYNTARATENKTMKALRKKKRGESFRVGGREGIPEQDAEYRTCKGEEAVTERYKLNVMWNATHKTKRWPAEGKSWWQHTRQRKRDVTQNSQHNIAGEGHSQRALPDVIKTVWFGWKRKGSRIANPEIDLHRCHQWSSLEIAATVTLIRALSGQWGDQWGWGSGSVGQRHCQQEMPVWEQTWKRHSTNLYGQNEGANWNFSETALLTRWWERWNRLMTHCWWECKKWDFPPPPPYSISCKPKWAQCTCEDI